MENRTWKKPGKKFFKEVCNDMGFYIPVTYNSLDTGWSDGHICFFKFTPEDGAQLPAPSLRQNIWMERDRKGKMGKTNMEFNNPLDYLITIEDEGVSLAFFERLGSTRYEDSDWPVVINDGYLNAIMYYARKQHGRKVKVRFYIESLAMQKYSKARANPILVMVNDDEPFAMVMPMREDKWTLKMLQEKVRKEQV